VNSAIFLLKITLAAVDAYTVPARSQARGKLFGEGLKPAVPGGNSASAEYRDARCPPPQL